MSRSALSTPTLKLKRTITKCVNQLITVTSYNVCMAEQSLFSSPLDQLEPTGGITHGFLLALASLLGGGIFFLPQAVEALSLAWAVTIILGCGAAFAVTTVMFATALDRHLDTSGARDTTNFVGSMLTAHLGVRPAKIVAALLLTQSVLLLYGYVHEVSGRSGSLLGMPALLLAAGVAMTIVIQQRRESIKSSICLLYTSPSPRDQRGSRMPSSA